jgi:hypothetical protein
MLHGTFVIKTKLKNFNFPKEIENLIAEKLKQKEMGKVTITA